MHFNLRAAIVAAALILPSQAHADDHNGATEMMRGDYHAAERRLVREQRLFPEHADLALNLAAVFDHQGRINEARALYRGVLMRPDDNVMLSSARTSSSHALAKTALARLDRVQLSAR